MKFRLEIETDSLEAVGNVQVALDRNGEPFRLAVTNMGMPTIIVPAITPVGAKPKRSAVIKVEKKKGNRLSPRFVFRKSARIYRVLKILGNEPKRAFLAREIQDAFNNKFSTGQDVSSALILLSKKKHIAKQGQKPKTTYQITAKGIGHLAEAEQLAGNRGIVI